MKHVSSNIVRYYLPFLFIILIAVLFRFSCLTLRPMHTDEAVHAIKFGALLEYGYYRYDKNEYHGPTLNYFTLPAAWIKSRKTLSSLDESTLRIIPACAGIGMILLLFFLFDGFGLTLIIIISLLTAISPLLIFYSRYYIQETLLVFFNFGSIVSIYRFIQSGKTPWLIITGIFLGLMYATKETSLMNFLIMILAFCFTLYIRFKKYKEAKKYLLNYRPWHIILLAGTAIMVSVLFYSSFFSNMKGVIDSITTHQAYFSKAGSGEVHIHPWYYYLQLLIFSKSPSGMIWSEVWIIICACAGFFYLTKKRNDHSIHYYLILFIGINTLLQVLVYSAIPYKTPWNMMGFYHGLIIIAAYGIYQVFNTNMKLSNRIIPVVFTLAGSLHLIIQAFLLNFKTPTDPYHPYVYAQTGNDIFEIVSRIDSVSSANPLGKEMPVDVIFPGHDYWPLPWYLRTYKNVGYREHVDLNQPAAPLILSSPDVEKEIIHYLYEAPPPGEKYLYVPLFDTYMELRPMVEIKGYLRKDAWDHFNQARFR